MGAEVGASDAGAARAESPRIDPRAVRWSRIAWGAAALLTFALAAVAVPAIRHLRETPEVAGAIQFTIPTPENAQFGGPPGPGTGAATQLAISPDGRYIALVARTGAKFTVWLRSLATLEVRQLPGTDDASFPFWSPDSRAVDGLIERVRVLDSSEKWRITNR
jgi:eukaryotic-like serine/threonine-protein kinase